jgi:hypothetical protein
MKRIAAGLIAAGAALAIAAPAQAHVSPTDGYCDDSLRGYRSLAPDNDIKARWDYLEQRYGWNIVSSYITEVARINEHDVYFRYDFVAANGSTVSRPLFRCWRENATTSHTGTYHDGFIN